MNELSIEDLKQLYEDCLCRYKEKPVIISGIVKHNLFEIQYLEDEEYDTVEYIPDLFDFTPIRIGYVNYRGYAYYFVRNPIRQWKQGTCATNTTQIFTEFKKCGADMSKRIQENSGKLSELTRKEVFKAIMRQYPTIPEIMISLDKEKQVYSIAFDPQFAITFENNLLYRNTIVGTVSKDGSIALKPKYEYLTRALYVTF